MAATPLGPLLLEWPVPASLDPQALALVAVALFRLRLSVVPTLALMAAAGLLLKLALPG